MMTAYIVSHPLAGAVRSKAIFRLCGTLVGTTVALRWSRRWWTHPYCCAW
jgi:uncharacterized membrane protein YccC